jgi:SH3 domain protein
MRLLFLSLLAFSLTLQAGDLRKGTVTVDNLRMRSKAGTPSNILGVLTKGTTVQVIDEKDGWIKVIAPKSLTAWTSSRFIENGLVIGDDVHIRSGPGIAHRTIGRLEKGAKVEILEIKKDIWSKIIVPNNITVWVSAAFIQLEPLLVVEQEVDLEKERLAKEKAALLKLELETLKVLQAKLDIEKKATRDARKKLLEQEKELARLELEKNSAEIAKKEEEKKVQVIQKLLEIEEKKHGKKLIVSLSENGDIKIGSQITAFTALKTNYEAAGPNTLVFITSEKDTPDQLIKKVSDHFKELKAKVYFEDPSKLLGASNIQLTNSYQHDKMILDKSYITLTVKKPKLLYIGTVPIPDEHLESILKAYGNNFGNSSAYIQADPGADPVFIDKLMNIVQLSGFKLISYPQGADGHEVVAEQPIEFTDEQKQPLADGRIRMTGYILNVREADRDIVDYALAVKVNKQYYPIAFLKEKKQEMQSFYLKEVEIIGVQKRLEGWTKPILFVEQFKLTK